MKNRKLMGYFVAALVVCSAVFSNAARKDERTLLMVPREEETVRLGMDIANKYPTLLISYKLGANNAVSLHGWTGSQWVNVTLDAFHNGDFFKMGPDSALVIEKAGIPVPGKMLPPPGWCASASKITTTEMRPLLHLVGQYYDFSYKDWQWFAKRYNMDMDAINPEGLNVAWYHRRMSEHLTPSDQQGANDLQYWVSIRQPTVVAVPAVQDDTAKQEPVPAEESEQVLTNEAPEAVILGAGDADEELSETTEKADEPVAEEKAAEEETAAREAAAAEKVPEEQAPAEEAAVEEKAPDEPEEKAPENEEEM